MSIIYTSTLVVPVAADEDVGLAEDVEGAEQVLRLLHHGLLLTVAHDVPIYKIRDKCSC